MDYLYGIKLVLHTSKGEVECPQVPYSFTELIDFLAGQNFAWANSKVSYEDQLGNWKQVTKETDYKEALSCINAQAMHLEVLELKPPEPLQKPSAQVEEQAGTWKCNTCFQKNISSNCSLCKAPKPS